MKKSNPKSKKSNQRQSTPLYSVYGARISKSKKFVNVSLVNGEEDDKQWATACVSKKGKYVKVKVTEDAVILTIPRLDVEDEEDEEDEDEEDEEDDKPLTDEGLKPVNEDDLPF